MKRQRLGNHTVSRLTVHLVWVTKYRYKVLIGNIQKRCRALIRQDCETLEIKILSGVIRNDEKINLQFMTKPFLDRQVKKRKINGAKPRLFKEVYRKMAKSEVKFIFLSFLSKDLKRS